MKPPISPLVPATSVVLYSLLAATTALGQITPDNTLGKVSSVVTPNVNVNGDLADLIEGGAIRDSNLFHSFSDFNVGEMGRVYFANPAGIANILSRVTGTNVSNILGTLGVLGNANLFVINPNGIFFGPNSRLDLGGSFFGSTADSVLFEDGTVFSTKNPNDKPLLTINIPSGLQYGSNPGSITNQSSLFLVPNGQTLGLIGGQVNIPGGFNIALDGRIELGGVGSNGVVKLTPTDTSFVLDYSGVQGFQDISLSEGARVITSGEGGGSIQVQGANVSLRDRSFVFADTEGSGSGGGIVVKSSQLSLEGGSRITTDVTGSGQGGDLTVDASESVRVVGVSANGTPSVLRAQVIQGATGNGGDVSITTGQLMVSDGAEVSANTGGEGDSGNLTVNASESVGVIGTSANGRPSALLAVTIGTGKAGETRITTGELIVSGGAGVSASTGGEGDGGDLTVDADSIQLIGRSTDGR
ncbi:MAG: filamentous hemagglutinin N-terminal domain-containing protein, partial [Moorea sp. SIO3G5]|nr:filamentous hemagglutinin N-terminal domain-containing protein [Moorena sp. SIO3G5]